MNPIEECFFRFLKLENAYILYLTAHFLRGRDKNDVLEFMQTTPPTMWLSSAFTWADTDEGHYFWENISNKWKYFFYSKLKYVKYGA